MTSRILIVEDDSTIASVLADCLEQNSFATSWLDSGSQVVDWVKTHNPDLVLLDLILPDKDGMTLCRELREFSTVPVIMVTGRVEEIDRLLGLELGADDFVCKPFSPREVVARVKAVLRRQDLAATVLPDADPNLVVDEAAYRAVLDGRLLDLTLVEFRLLKALSDRPGWVFSRNQLMDRVYDDGRVVSDRTMDTHVKNLRRKLGEVRPGCNLIQSVYGAGYRFERDD